MKIVLIILLSITSIVVNAQIITTFGGNGLSGNTGDGTPATASKINYPAAGVFDKNNNYYITTGTSGNRIRKISCTGIITTIAGTGIQGYSGDGFAATLAQFNNPQCITIDTSNNLYISDAYNHVIRKIDAITNIITTYAGNNVAGYNSDNIPATAAQLNDPNGVSFDKFGNLYIADYMNNRVRKVNAAGIITTVAGTGVAGYNGDGGLADTSQLRGVLDVCTDNLGNLYIADEANGRIRKVDGGGIIHTIAGTGVPGYSGDSASATLAQVTPHGMIIDKDYNLYFSDIYVDRVRKVSASGIIFSIAGNGMAGYSGDNGPATAAMLKNPFGLAVDSCNNLYINEGNNFRIRKVSFYPGCNLVCSSPPNAINEIKKSEQTLSFPNPVTAVLHINNIQPGSSYMLYEMTGRAVATGVLNKKDDEIDMAHIAKGIYLLQVQQADGRKAVYKVVKE